MSKVHVVPKKLTAKEIASCGVMAAVMAVAAFIPVTVVAGVGKVISAAVMLEPLIGVLLGPVLGTYAAAGGAVVGQFIAPQGAIFGPLTFIPPTVGTLTAGLLAHKHWKAASGVMITGLLLWYSTSIGRELYYYPYMPLLFLGLVLLFRSNLGEWIHVKYKEIVGFQGTGIKIMVTGLLLIVCAFTVFSVYGRDVLTLGVLSSAAAGALLLGYVLKADVLLKKLSVTAFLSGAILFGISIFTSEFHFIFSITVVFLCITFFLLGLLLLEYESVKNVFLLTFVLFGMSASIFVVQLTGSEIQILLQKISYILVIAGIILFSFIHFQGNPLKKWSGVTLFTGGLLGVIQQVLLFSLDSQVIKKELLQLESVPFSTFIFGREFSVTSVLDYYTKKVFPVYVYHIGVFLIFVALLIIGISFLLNVSLEKLSVAYFIIAGAAVLSDLMIGNFLAIQVLELNTGIFKAFLFIYPVERMFMAFFATIFGIGVFIPLKRYGINNLIRR